MLRKLFLLAMVLSTFGASAQMSVLKKGMVISRSVVIKPGIYRIPSGVPDKAPVIIEGNNITVDFNGAVLEGSSDLQHPDTFTGTAVLIRGGKNITVKNLVVKGYKIGIRATGINGLVLTGNDLSYNFRQRLNSDRKGEDLSDWMSFHQNEKDEWLRFGAGIYLRNCNNARIFANSITNGQCGLMITASNNAQIYNNNFSFNSGIGIGMYRSSNNKVISNRIDWNIRGYSHGVYYRGQDSAGILTFEQCNNNTFAYNSVTHSGDGFFLWAGQTSMDTGEGGCNDNMLFRNDFSFAATNAVELTFSRNKIIGNILHGSWHGVWGGFSYNTIIANNDFADNLSSIAIEHGNDNVITQNDFKADKVGLEIYSNPKRVKDIGYLKNRDTRSRNYEISENTFTGMKNILAINNTEHVQVINTRLQESTLQQKVDSTIKDISFVNIGDQVRVKRDTSYFPDIKPIGPDVMLPKGHPRGKEFMMMTEWGPYNFKYPLTWLVKADSTGKLAIDLRGPAGKWAIRSMKGVSQPSASSGELPATITVQKSAEALTDIEIAFEYTGDAIISPFGEQFAKGKPYPFYYREFAAPMQWEMKWFAFDTLSAPVKAEARFKELITQRPVKVNSGKEIGKVFGQNFGKNIARERIATVSETEVTVPQGKYRIGISAAELVRVYVDDKLIIENWDPKRIVYDGDYHRDATLSLSGKHRIRVEQAQNGSYGMINFILQPVH